MLAVVVAPAYARRPTESAQVITVRALRGRVVIQNTRDPLDDVLVEECSSNWKTVLQSTHSDEAGHFALSAQANHGVHYLRFTMPGMQTTTVRVRTTMLAARGEVWVEMPAAP